tara:strand:+ start:14528 stop:15517 length:990 start_codon:yes stop_codon:yes gene_type:complete
MNSEIYVQVEWDIGPVDIIEQDKTHGAGNWTLPKKVVKVPVQVIDDSDSDVADWLSDNHGWLVKGYSVLENDITTFDGVIHNREEILEKMIDDDFYYGYLGKQAMSSSAIKTLMQSPKVYVDSLENGSPSSQALTDGKLFHWKILEPDKFDELHIVDVASKASKAYKEAKAEFGEVYTSKEVAPMVELAEIMMKNKEVAKYLEGASFEVPAIQMIDGVPFRGKADIIKDNMIIDLKTTGKIKDFEYSALNFGYDLQAYLYLQLFPEMESFVFICIDKKTKDIGIYECSNTFLESGRRKLVKGLEDYKKFIQSGMDLEQHTIHKTLNGRL